MELFNLIITTTSKMLWYGVVAIIILSVIAVFASVGIGAIAMYILSKFHSNPGVLVDDADDELVRHETDLIIVYEKFKYNATVHYTTFHSGKFNAIHNVILTDGTDVIPKINEVEFQELSILIETLNMNREKKAELDTKPS